MTLQLDQRRVAMLHEMGLRLLPPWQAPAAGDAEGAPEVPASAGAAAKPLVPRTGAELPPDVARLDWPALQDAVEACRACGLCQSRRRTVFGAGPRRADWLVLGDAPNEQEEQQGEPFVGPEGKLLDNMLRSIGLDRQRNVHLANVLRCRPPGNRNPDPLELAQCEPFLRRQVQLLQPRVILAMGRFAVQSLLQSQEPIGRLRGRVHDYHGIPLIVTFHPAYLLRNLPDKAKAWADLCLAMDTIESTG
jgi:uracil-DNA glycosylase family 4